MRGGGADEAIAVEDPDGAIATGRGALASGVAGGWAGMPGADGDAPAHAAIAKAIVSDAQRCVE